MKTYRVLGQKGRTTIPLSIRMRLDYGAGMCCPLPRKTAR